MNMNKERYSFNAFSKVCFECSFEFKINYHQKNLFVGVNINEILQIGT